MRVILPLLLVFIFVNNALCSNVVEKDTLFKNVKDNVIRAENDVNKIYKEENGDIKYSNSRLGFIHGFLASIYVIIISELGDKTFFIAAIMSIKNSRLVVYAGAMLALTSMTILSAALGMATTIIPRKVTYYLSGFLFLVFGLKMLKDAYDMSPSDAKEEYEEVQAELRKRDSEYAQSKQLVTDPETGVMTVVNSNNINNNVTTTMKNGGSRTNSPTMQIKSERSPTHCLAFCSSRLQNIQKVAYLVLSKVFVESFVLTFLAEWGDRSQMTTIVLAATKDVIGVIVGGTLGHGLCTGLAVMSGRFISQRIPVRALTLIGAITFLVFAFHTFIVSDPLSNS